MGFTVWNFVLSMQPSTAHSCWPLRTYMTTRSSPSKRPIEVRTQERTQTLSREGTSECRPSVLCGVRISLSRCAWWCETVFFFLLMLVLWCGDVDDISAVQHFYENGDANVHGWRQSDRTKPQTKQRVEKFYQHIWTATRENHRQQPLQVRWWKYYQ